MNENTARRLVMPAATSQDVLTEVLRDGAQRLLGQAIEIEIRGWLESHEHAVDENGRRQVVGNGRLPTRTIVTGVGPVEVSQRRVHDVLHLRIRQTLGSGRRCSGNRGLDHRLKLLGAGFLRCRQPR